MGGVARSEPRFPQALGADLAGRRPHARVFRRRIKRYAEDQRGDLAYLLFCHPQADNVLVGGMTLANIRRGCRPDRQPRILDGGGLCPARIMTAAVAAVVPFGS